MYVPDSHQVQRQNKIKTTIARLLLSRDFLITLVIFYLDLKIFFIFSGIFTLEAYVSTLPSLFCKQIGQIYIFDSQKKKYEWIKRNDKMSKLTENHEIQKYSNK